MDSTNAVVVEITDGLGNQLFQYASARALAMRFSAPLILDLRWFQKREERQFLLSSYKIEATEANEEVYSSLDERFRIKSPGKLMLALRRFSLRYKKVGNWTLAVDAFRGYDKRLLMARPPAYLVGCWQNDAYFESIGELLRDEFQLRFEMDNVNRQYGEYLSQRAAVAIHIRRGDKVSNPVHSERYVDLTPEYYLHNAVLMAEILSTKPVFAVFSDDIPWAREHLPLPGEALFFDHNGSDAVRDLWLMTQCRHHIIANSTFSWWGAWLAEKPGQIVLAPATKYRVRRYNRSYHLPARWKRVPINVASLPQRLS